MGFILTAKGKTMSKQNFGNSLLPSHDSNTYREQVTRFGILKVIPWPETEQHALMYEDTRKLGFSMLAEMNLSNPGA